jgi:hypothetical protein
MTAVTGTGQAAARVRALLALPASVVDRKGNHVKRVALLACMCIPALASLELTPAIGLAKHRLQPTGAPLVSTCCGTASVRVHLIAQAAPRVVLTGHVDPHGRLTHYRFQYGRTRAYGSETRRMTAGSGTTSIRVQALLRRLAKHATYHFRIVAWNHRGVRYGRDATFSTVTRSTLVVRHRKVSDTTPPTAPAGLTATPGDAQVSLAWQASSDNVGVAGYRVYRNGTEVAQVSSLAYTDTGLVNGTSYTYDVVAYDAAGNASTPSNTASATPVSTTPPPPPPPPTTE